MNDLLENLDLVIVIDLEATCWADNPPPDQEMEIIEIGICPFEIATRKRLLKRSILVRPSRSTVSEYCTQLTTLTPAQVAHGIPLKEACAILEHEFLTKKRTWASWGDFDRLQFSRECRSKNIPYPFSEKHLNIKTLFAEKKGLKKQVELVEALQMLGYSFEGTYHRAFDDSYNIAFVLSALISEERL